MKGGGPVAFAAAAIRRTARTSEEIPALLFDRADGTQVPFESPVTRTGNPTRATSRSSSMNTTR
jgi:hypothetical protein